jgi:hypothetical protein
MSQKEGIMWEEAVEEELLEKAETDGGALLVDDSKE